MSNNNNNRLTASGLLYEGSDFNQWLDSQRSVLVVYYQQILILRYDSGHLVRGVDPDAYNDFAAIVWWRVSPHLTSRISEKSRQKPGHLLDALESASQPFRLIDLPAEIRLRVYGFEVASRPSEVTLRLLGFKQVIQPGKDRITTYEYFHNSMREPSLVSTNRQIRTEALPVYYQRTTFGLVFNERIRSDEDLWSARHSLVFSKKWQCRPHGPTNAEKAHAVNTWQATLMSDNVKLLRQVSVQLPPLGVCSKTGCEDMLHFSLRPRDGEFELRVEKHDWLVPKSRKMISDHTATISKLAQSTKAEGEAFVMVLTSRPDIWSELESARTRLLAERDDWWV